MDVQKATNIDITAKYRHRAHQIPPKLATVSSTIISSGPVGEILACLVSSHVQDSCHKPPKQMYQVDQSENFCHLG
jgi:hypothetical protein